MEKRKLALLKYLIQHGSEGYKVLEVSVILSDLKKYKGRADALLSDINFLASNKFLDVKYVDDISICYSVLDNTRILQENIRSEVSTRRNFLRALILTMILSGVMSFLGAFLAILILR